MAVELNKNSDSSKKCIKLNDNDVEESIEEDIVTPWEVKSSGLNGINYDKLIEKFGCQKLTIDLIERVENLTGKKAHVMLRRGLYFSHRDFQQILDCVEKKKPFYLYTGRGPSSGSLHLGHLVPFIFSKYLQDVFNVPLIIQSNISKLLIEIIKITDDEKYLWKSLSLEDAKKMANENIKDIISVGFNPSNTFIFTNTDYIPAFYENILKIWRSVTINQCRAIFGFSGEDSMGKVAFPAIEAAPCFSSSFPQIFNNQKNIPCLIPCAIDQDPYFRMTRDVAPKLKYQKPSLIFSSFLPSLQGSQCKMSASNENTCIYINDSPNQIKNKINKYAFSGGQETAELHRKFGGNCETDTAFQFLRYFYEDDEKLEEIQNKYKKGEILSGELKKIAIDCIQKIIADLQKRRANITDDEVKKFTSERKLSAFTY